MKTILMMCIAAALLAAAAPALAETAPVKIEVRQADKVDYDAGAKLIVLTGSVHIVRGTMSLRGDRVEIRMGENEKQVQSATATGRVEIEDGTRRGRAERAVFMEGSSEITLTGSPRLWSEGNEIEAERIVYNLTTRSMRAEGRVRGTFIPGANF